jgi:S-adenosylmethionine synthetase
VAKNIVAAGNCDRCTIQLSYAIGIPSLFRFTSRPTTPTMWTMRKLVDIVRQVVDFSPRADP